MKTIVRIVCVLCTSFAFFACSKDNISSDIFYKAGFEAQIDSESDFASDSKVSVSAKGAVSWQSGDKILVAFTKSSPVINYEFSNTGGNYFSGTLSETDYKTVSESGKYLYFCYPSSIGDFRKIRNFPESGKNKHFYIDATQTGLLSDLGRNVFFIGKYLCSEGALSLDESQISFNGEVSLNCISPVVKFNVPASLNVKKIEIGAKLEGVDKNITTQFTIRNFDVESGVGVEGMETDVDGNGGTPILTIYQEGFKISGDVYAVLAPNYYKNSKLSFDARLKIDELDFTLTNMSDEQKTLKLEVGTLYGGKIVNLPAFPDSWSYTSPK